MAMNMTSDQPCVSICCKQDTIYPPDESCFWNVSFSTVKTLSKIIKPLSATRTNPKNSIIHYAIPCPNNTVCYSNCNSGNNISTYIFQDETVFMNDSINRGLTCRLGAEDYCFNSQLIDGTENLMSVCEEFFDLIANMKVAYVELSTHLPFFIYTMSISLFFFAATFLVYTIIPELKNLHGLILRTYVLCCFGQFLGMIITFTNSKISCSIFIMIPLHFAVLTTFFWLNIMCFDIWWTFRSLRDSARQSPRKKYIIYSIYAWGIPLVIIGVGLIIEFVPNVPPEIIKPGLHAGCWMKGLAPSAMYLHGPMTVTIVCNICFFILAAINITKQKKATAQCLEGTDSRRYNDEKNRFYLYLKLFIVMGLTWISEIQPFIVTLHIPKYALYILLFPNHIQGFIIFVLCVWNDKIKRILTKRQTLKDGAAIKWIQHTAAQVRTLARRQ